MYAFEQEIARVAETMKERWMNNIAIFVHRGVDQDDLRDRAGTVYLNEPLKMVFSKLRLNYNKLNWALKQRAVNPGVMGYLKPGENQWYRGCYKTALFVIDIWEGVPSYYPACKFIELLAEDHLQILKVIPSELQIIKP